MQKEITKLSEYNISMECSKERRIAVVGKSTVGKSSLVRQYIDHEFIDRHIPTADREWVKTDVFLESEFRLEVHDSSGMDDGTHIPASWVGTIDAFVIMYAINDRESFNIALLIRSKLAEAMGQCEETCSIPITLIGNKRDKKSERQITKAEVLNHIKDWKNTKFAEITCTSLYEVETIFAELIEIHERKCRLYTPQVTFWQKVHNYFKKPDMQIHLNSVH